MLFRGALKGLALLQLFLLPCVLDIIIPEALAQESQAPIQIVHSAPDLRLVETRQAWLPISVELRNTTDVNLTIRLVGSRDGRLLDLAFPKGALNANDNPRYEVEIPMPSAGMSYQFIVHRPDNTLVTSERFTIQRPCIQNFRTTVPEGSPDLEFKQKVGSLVSEVRLLEREISQLDAAHKALDELKRNIPEQ